MSARRWRTASQVVRRRMDILDREIMVYLAKGEPVPAETLARRLALEVPAGVLRAPVNGAAGRSPG